MEASELMMTKWMDRWKSEWMPTERWTDRIAVDEWTAD